MICTAKHENGTVWRFGVQVSKKRGFEHAKGMAANCARNYCRQKLIPGRVEVQDGASGITFFAVVGDDYTLIVE